MNPEFDVEHGDLEFTDYDFDGMVFERMHIITSKMGKRIDTDLVVDFNKEVKP